MGPKGGRFPRKYPLSKVTAGQFKITILVCCILIFWWFAYANTTLGKIDNNPVISTSETKENDTAPNLTVKYDIKSSFESSTERMVTPSNALKASKTKTSAPRLPPSPPSPHPEEDDNSDAKTLEQMLLDYPTMLSYLKISSLTHLRNDSVFSVTLKPSELIPKGASPHDYVSLSKYYWQDPDNPDGEWIRVDGRVNPIVETVKDYKYFRAMSDAVRTLTLSYYYLKDEKYAAKAVSRIEEWFMDEETLMNPNVDYGSMRINNPTGKGSQQGVLDIWPISRVLAATEILRKSPSYTAELHSTLQTWVSEYVDWLDNSPIAQREQGTPNNHATYYDVQYLSLLRFLGRTEIAQKYVLKYGHKRIHLQIDPKDGYQPHEASRPLSWYYCVFNLQAFIMLAQEAEAVGIDLYNYEARKGQSIKKAIDFLLPFALSRGQGGAEGQPWPRKNVGGWEIKNYLGVVQIAWARYGDLKYLPAIREFRKRAEEEEGGLAKMARVDEWICDSIKNYNGSGPSCKLLA